MKTKNVKAKSKSKVSLPILKPAPSLPLKADRFNEGKTQWGLIHFGSLTPMVKVLEFGAKKYSPDNWKNQMDKTKILESSMRHLAALIDGEILDPESGLPHAAHIQCNMMFFNFHSQANPADAK